MKKIGKIRDRISDYVYDSTIDIKERTFILFSIVVLFALYVAVPCGLIMREPLSATLSSIAGAVAFTVYLIYSFKTNRLARAKVVISFIVVFIFLPAMLFTNGGIESGAPIWLLLGSIYIAMILEGKLKIVMMTLEVVMFIICWCIAYFYPDLVTGYSRGGNHFDTLVALLIVSAIIYLMIEFQNRILSKEEEHKNVQRLFEQTATALVNAIDAKDTYTHGHSARVAEYSKKIAMEAGKSPAECEEIYYVALLHDVGKIGVPAAIINKEGRLTDEEYEAIKQHPELGAQILQGITEFPYISIGAHFHHERYDGKGYPFRLKGSDIPEVARIVAVADAYDAMTSKRSYRDSIPQDKVREEFIEGSGTQFDPEFANIMLHLIDLDSEYELKEREEVRDLSDKDELVIGQYRDDVSEGVLLTPNITTVTLRVRADKQAPGHLPKPVMIFFDSLDGRFHDDERKIKDLMYFEYGEMKFDGQTTIDGARKHENRMLVGGGDDHLLPGEYKIEAVKVKDHIMVRITDRVRTNEMIMALPDSTRYAYLALSGEHCRISNLSIEKSEDTVPQDYIPRIAEEISYIDGPVGDVPNVQVDGYRTASTDGIPIAGKMTITFHTKSLPTARLVWHCPSYVIFTSEDGKVNGPGYTEFSLVRIDGEAWEAGEVAKNEQVIDRQNFNGWDAWKQYNKEGYECTINFERDGEYIISGTENGGIYVRNTTQIRVETDKIYVAVSGDQCALTNIRIIRS